MLIIDVHSRTGAAAPVSTSQLAVQDVFVTRPLGQQHQHSLEPVRNRFVTIPTPRIVKLPKEEIVQAGGCIHNYDLILDFCNNRNQLNIAVPSSTVPSFLRNPVTDFIDVQFLSSLRHLTLTLFDIHRRSGTTLFISAVFLSLKLLWMSPEK